MAVYNRIITTPAGATGEEILDALMADLINNQGYTLLEDNNADDASVGSQFFAVQHQVQSNLDSQIILDFEFAADPASNGQDWIAVTIQERPWTVSVPSTTRGGGATLLNPYELSVADSSLPDSAMHRVSEGTGNIVAIHWYFDGDDATGLYLVIHSERGAVPGEGIRNLCGHFIGVCSIERTGQPNYGMLCGGGSGTGQKSNFNANTDELGWVPSKNHGGFSSNATIGWEGFIDPQSDRAAYCAQAPMLIESVLAPTRMGGMTEVDTFNNEDIAFPIYIGNRTVHQGTSSVPGFRGVLHGIFMWRLGVNFPWRQFITMNSGQRFLVYCGAPNAPGTTVPYLAVLAA